MIDVKNLHKEFKDPDGTVTQVLSGINYKVEKGEKIVIVGPSGSGKSTFLRCLNLLERPTSGQIFFDGEDITELSVDARAKKGIFLSFQNPLEVPGLSLEAFLRNAIREKTGKPVKIFQFKKRMEEVLDFPRQRLFATLFFHRPSRMSSHPLVTSSLLLSRKLPLWDMSALRILPV